MLTTGIEGQGQRLREQRRGPLQQTAQVLDRQEGPRDRRDHPQEGRLRREPLQRGRSATTNPVVINVG